MAARRQQLGPRTHPLVLRWHEPGAPFPLRQFRSIRPQASPGVNHEAAHYLETGPPEKPFDFCGHVRRLLEDVVRRCPQLKHVEPARILLAATQARSGRAHGLQARVTPLRFAAGALTRRRRGVTYQVQRYFLGDHEYLYLMAFCLPRFLDQDFDNKFVTLFHELFHLSPACDGDLRRHGGRYYVHTHDPQAYDRHMLELARAYLATRPEPGLFAFLRLDFGQLVRRHGAVSGIVVPHPKVVPLLNSGESSADSPSFGADAAVE